MSPHSVKYPRQPDAVETARAALLQGPLIRTSVGTYFSGHRYFAPKTVRALIAAGEAIEAGTGVVHVESLRWGQPRA